MSNFFSFEDKKTDIPFYNGKPPLSLADWGIVIFGILLSVVLLTGKFSISSYEFSMLIFLVLTVPALYICKGNYSLFFKKPKRSDIKLILLCLIGYYLYVIVIVGILYVFGIKTNASAVLSSDMNQMFWITVFFQIMGEEFFKILIFIVVIALTFHFTKNRKMSIYIGLTAVCLAFGLIHYNAYGSLLQILLIQGLGSIFEMYAYLKTKNVVVTYLLHIIVDAIPFIIVTIMKMNNITAAG